MRSRTREAIARFLLAASLAAVAPQATIAAAAPDSLARRDPACGPLTIVQAADVVIYRLPRTFLTGVADSARTPGRILRAGSDYLVDPLRGELRLLRFPVPGESLTVEACWLVDAPPLEYRRLRYTPAPHAPPESAKVEPVVPVLRPGTARDPREVPGGTALSINGNKTIAVEFGSSQDAFLRQSLDLSVSGSLAPGVELTGVLSDRNTPLTASGSTQDLQSLDRVLLELKTPSGKASFGDVSLVTRDGEFARVERQLQGVRAEWTAKGFTGTVAAASAPGEFHRMQFNGVDGQQGPYLLTDRDGGTAITIIAGSEVVTVDGARLTRGESADYSIEYDRARLTFSNRRPISSASRITVDYQYTVNRYRRSFAEAGGRWDRGPLQLFTRVLTEGDDRARPLDIAFDASDRLALAFAGDSLEKAIGNGVTPGGGDYDSVRVGGRLIYAFAGPDSGEFAVRFARVGAGQGDYADSIAIAGRNAYRYVGAGNGTYRIGQALPLPESHQLWAFGGIVRQGVLTFEGEGAFSRRDLNTASALDDQDDRGAAGRVSIGLEGGDIAKAGRAGIHFTARDVDRRFAPFGRLEQPFAQEDWGLPIGGDLERQRRLEATGFLGRRAAGELRWRVASLETPDGFRAFRRGVEWKRDGVWGSRASWDRSDGDQAGVRYGRGGRERAVADFHVRAPWVEPALRAEYDLRRTPDDSTRIGVRAREASLDLGSGGWTRWRATVGGGLRREGNAVGEAFPDRLEARTMRGRVESPPDAPLVAALALQRRDVRPIGDGDRTRSDLASLRLASESPERGLGGSANLEVTSEGETRRTRVPAFVGTGLGAYDALGNFVGRGDYDLAIVVLPGLQKVSRAALSARTDWTWGKSETWRGSHVEFSFEGDARRRGDFRIADAVVSPGVVLGDPQLSQGSLAQRIETELAPGAKFSNLRLRVERRVTADRSFDNFAQTVKDETGQLRWRARFDAAWSTELEGRLRRQEAVQSVTAGSDYRRVLVEQGLNSQWIVQPGDRLRLVWVTDAAWSRPEGQRELTRTIRLGPDVSSAVGSRGRATISVRRAFIAGPAALGLLPSVDPAGAARWDLISHADLRVRESTTFGLSFAVSERPGLKTQSNGRAELRAFF